MSQSMLPQEGEVWEHVATKQRYRVIGRALDASDDVDVVIYVPMYDPVDGYEVFTRRLFDHPKAWFTRKDDGVPRYVRVDEA